MANFMCPEYNRPEIDAYTAATMPEPKLPHGRKGAMTKVERRYVKGGVESIRRLKMNGFDPIDELVWKYRKLEKELEFYELWRDGVIKPLNAAGHVRGYNENSAANHLMVYDKLLKVADSLLRYAYGRVPENVNLNAANSRAPLIINLSKDEASYSIAVNNKENEENDGE
jgi:hypothetical protein